MELGLIGWLRVAWVAAIFPLLVASIPSSKLRSFHGVVLGFARRGKIMKPSSYKLTVPQKFFCHFYVVGVVWTTFLLFTTWAYAYKMAPSDSEGYGLSRLASHLTGASDIFSFQKARLVPVKHRSKIWRSVFLLLLMEAQVLRRLIETFYIFNYSSSARMHVLGYLTGLFFYTAAPLSLCCTSAQEVFRFTANQVAEFIVQGKGQMLVNGIDWWVFVSPLLKMGWAQWIGSVVFLWGWIHQRRCHAILGSLREHREQHEDYVIPHGDWFELVSSPHYLAEIVIYAGLVVASGGRELTIWLLFGFVVANLALAAAETHRWYLRKFDNYPGSRFVIIPYVY